MTDAAHQSDIKENCGQGVPAMSIALFIFGSAFLYAGAMIAMKLWGQIPPAMLLTAIALLMGGGIYFEIGALQIERLGMVYVLILGIEVVIIAMASSFWFGESFTWKEITGGLLIVAGTAVAWS